jgi:hypothetical protein
MMDDGRMSDCMTWLLFARGVSRTLHCYSDADSFVRGILFTTYIAKSYATCNYTTYFEVYNNILYSFDDGGHCLFSFY